MSFETVYGLWSLGRMSGTALNILGPCAHYSPCGIPAAMHTGIKGVIFYEAAFCIDGVRTVTFTLQISSLVKYAKVKAAIASGIK